MAYKHDADLEFLASCDDKDLDDLVYILTHDIDGEKRLTEELSSYENYKKYYPQHTNYWQEIAAEIQYFGASTLATLFREREGVAYRKVLSDAYAHVTNKKADSGDSVQNIEDNLLMFIFNKAIEKMSLEELTTLATELNIDLSKPVTTANVSAAAQSVLNLGNTKSYQLALIIVNSLSKTLFSRGFSLAINRKIGRIEQILKSSLATITGEDPVYSVTVPVVMQVALLRKKESLSKEKAT